MQSQLYESSPSANSVHTKSASSTSNNPSTWKFSENGTAPYAESGDLMDAVAKSSDQTVDKPPFSSNCNSKKQKLNSVTNPTVALPTCNNYHNYNTYLPTTPNESWTYIEQDGAKFICTCTGRWCTCRTTIKRTSSELRDGHK